ncbi:hypothetical protein IJ579_08425 [bacterium]|nr:hypothetical protein [bacterium]
MLTIQPNFVTKTSMRPVFTANDSLLDEDYVNEQRDFFEQQRDNFDQIIEDDYVPGWVKKGAKVFRIISEGILEGWAVAWGATKSAKFVRSSSTKAVESGFYKGAKNILKPIKESFGKFVSGKWKALMSTEFMLKRSNEINEFLEKNSVGKAINSFIQGIKGKYGKLVEKTKDITFDQVTNVTAGTLGVGSGAMGAYNSAISERNMEVAEDEEFYDEVA